LAPVEVESAVEESCNRRNGAGIGGGETRINRSGAGIDGGGPRIGGPRERIKRRAATAQVVRVQWWWCAEGRHDCSDGTPERTSAVAAALYGAREWPGAHNRAGAAPTADVLLEG
jgi:hypothetical protein